MAQLEPTMFREYDLRGRLNDYELNERSVFLIARAFASMLYKRGIQDVVLGYDLRLGSPEMASVAVKALLSSGINVIKIGQVMTPMLYAAQHHYRIRGGVMLTASHNPNGWLGFKLSLGLSSTLGPSEMKELKELTISEEFHDEKGTLSEKDFLPAYTKDVVSRVYIKRPIRVLVNAGNGTAGGIVPQILRQAGCEVFEFLTEPDLEFRRYFPNPSQEIMIDRKSVV